MPGRPNREARTPACFPPPGSWPVQRCRNHDAVGDASVKRAGRTVRGPLCSSWRTVHICQRTSSRASSGCATPGPPRSCSTGWNGPASRGTKSSRWVHSSRFGHCGSGRSRQPVVRWLTSRLHQDNTASPITTCRGEPNCPCASRPIACLPAFSAILVTSRAWLSGSSRGSGRLLRARRTGGATCGYRRLRSLNVTTLARGNGAARAPAARPWHRTREQLPLGR